MTFVPEGYCTFEEARGIFERWLTKRLRVNFESDEHLRREASNQLRQSLVARDIFAFAFDASAGRGSISGEHWMEDSNFEQVLAKNIADYPGALSKNGFEHRPVFIDESNLLNRFYGRSDRRVGNLGRTKPYRMLEWPERESEPKKYTQKAEQDATRACRLKLEQDTAQELRSGTLKELPEMSAIGTRAQDRIIGRIRADYPHISNPGAPKKK